MQFRIADTLTDSLARLTGEEQKAVKTTAFDLQMDPARPGLKLHQVEGAKDKGFWSARVSRDIRLIVHRTASSFLLCYVDHHDAAYQWAEHVEEVYSTERHLLYVACTRARDRLLVTGVEPASEFLDDLRG